MVTILDLYDSNSNFIMSDIAIFKNSINDEDFYEKLLEKFGNIFYTANNSEDTKIVVKNIDEYNNCSEVYVFDVDSKTLLRKFRKTGNRNLNLSNTYSRLDLSTTENYKYRQGDHVKYRRNGFVYNGIIECRVNNGAKFYKIIPDRIYKSEPEFDRLGNVDKLFDIHTDLIHQDDIIEVEEIMNLFIEYSKFIDGENTYYSRPRMHSINPRYTYITYESFEEDMKTYCQNNIPESNTEVKYVYYILGASKGTKIINILMQKMSYNKIRKKYLRYICYKIFHDGRIQKIDGFDEDEFPTIAAPECWGVSFRISDSDKDDTIIPFKLGDVVCYRVEYTKRYAVVVNRNMDIDYYTMGKGINRVYELINIDGKDNYYIHHDDILYKLYNDLDLLREKVYTCNNPFSEQHKKFIDDYITANGGK